MDSGFAFAWDWAKRDKDSKAYYACANCWTVTSLDGKEIGEKNSNDALINCIDVTVTTVTQQWHIPFQRLMCVCVYSQKMGYNPIIMTKVKEIKRKYRIKVITIWIGSNWNYKIL